MVLPYILSDITHGDGNSNRSWNNNIFASFNTEASIYLQTILKWTHGIFDHDLRADCIGNKN